MTTAPLSYDSLRTVLLYMEANQRFQLSRRVPSIRKTDEAVPLCIDHIEFEEMKTTINETSYQMGIYWHYGTATPAFHQKINEDGGSKSELDRYGYWTCSDSFPLAEGDLNLTGTPLIIDSDIERFDEETVREREKACDFWRIEMNVHTFLSQQTDIKPESTEGHLRNIESTRNSIASCRFDIEKYHMRLNNIDPPFTHYLQLTVKSPNGSEYIERIEYTGKKLFESMRYLNSILFKQRKHTVLVKKPLAFTAKYIVRLPSNFTIRIKNLNAKRVPFSCFDKTIDPTSCPLNYVAVSNLDDLKHKFAKSARKLVIENSVQKDDWLPTLLELTNDCVILNVKNLPFQTYIEFIRNRLRNGAAVGTSFFFWICFEYLGNLLRECKLFENAEHRGGTVSVPMDGNYVLKIFLMYLRSSIASVSAYYINVDVEQA